MKTMPEIRDALLEVLKDHRAHCTDLQCCELANMIAFLCHATGLRSLSDVAPHLLHYDLHCPGCDSGRDRMGK